MSWSVYRCTRCGKRLKYGQELFIGKYSYGPKCYKIMVQKQLELDIFLNRKAERENH